MMSDNACRGAEVNPAAVRTAGTFATAIFDSLEFIISIDKSEQELFGSNQSSRLASCSGQPQNK